MPQEDMFYSLYGTISMSARRRSYWHPENMQALQHYMALAATSLQQGDRERAIECWEVALERFPTLPVPRRQRLVQLIVTSWHEEARAALRRTSGYRRAISCLRRAWRTLESNPYPVGPGRSLSHGTTLRGETARVLGFLLHLEGNYAEASSLYEETDAAPEHEVAQELTYARALLHLQGAQPIYGSALHRAVFPSREVGRSEDRRIPRRRLAAFAKLLAAGATESAAEALALFPLPDTPRLPCQWALEGALLAALNDDRARCLAYYRVALAHPRAALPDLHRYVLLTVVGRDEPAVQPANWYDDVLLSWVIPSEGNERLFPNRALFTKWREAVMLWRHRVWLMKARTALALGHSENVRQYVDAAVRAQPRQRLSRHLRLWLACTDADRMESVRGRWDTRDVSLLRLSVLAAERWETTEHVVSRLNHLLQRFPKDAWGLARWRQWMIWLGEQSLSQGHNRQALLQFASLLMHEPDSVSGWNGCGRAHAAAGNGPRAQECFAEARRIARQFPSAVMNPRAAEGQVAPDETFDEAADEVLAAILREADEVQVSLPSCPVSRQALREELRKSLRRRDVYLRTFIQRWAETPGTERTKG